MTKIVSRPHHSSPIGSVDDKPVIPSQEYQNFFDELSGESPKIFTVATLPAVPVSGIIMVSDETGGATLAFSDGSNWRRVQDRAIVS